MSLMASLLMLGTLAATTNVVAVDVTTSDAAPPAYEPPPAERSPPPPPVLYGPPPIYVRPVYVPPPPPGYPRIRVYPAPEPGGPATPVPAVLVPLGSQPYTHDGFYLHFGVGGGLTSATHHDGAGNNIAVLGGSADISAAAGWSVARNVVVFGALFVSGMDAPSVKVNGAATNTAGTSGTFGGFGVGTGFFIEPANIYISAAVATMTFRFSDTNDQTIYETDWGLGFQAMVGKEWWVTPEWGAGIAVDLKTAYLDDKGPGSQPWSLASAALVFSLTYN
jgi:hypothetical protein